MLKNSYSQHGQDLRAIQFFNNSKNLFFIDIGANEGIIISNTYLFEKKFGWKGICSEPLPNVFESLTKNRDVICDNNAIYSTSNLQLKFSVHRWLSGITKYIGENNRTKKKPQILVNTITLQDLLQKYNAPAIIHYMSLDTEGSEYEILKSVNLSDYKFLYICVEHNFDNKKRNNIFNLLINNKYLYKGSYRQDDEFIHEDAIIGKYYMNNDYTKEIIVNRTDRNTLSVSSPYFETDKGTLNLKDFEINWDKLGKSKLYYNCIDFGNNNIWFRN